MFEEANKLDDEADFYDDLATWVALDEDDGSQLESLREQARNIRKKAGELVVNDKMYVVCNLTTTICMITIASTSRGKKRKQLI